MLTATSGRSVVTGEAWGEGEGLESRSAKGSGAGASSMHSERGVVDILIEQMAMGCGLAHIADGCLL